MPNYTWRPWCVPVENQAHELNGNRYIDIADCPYVIIIDLPSMVSLRKLRLIQSIFWSVTLQGFWSETNIVSTTVPAFTAEDANSKDKTRGNYGDTETVTNGDPHSDWYPLRS